MCEKDLFDYLQALLTPAIGLLAIVLGVLQWRINEARLRHELFEKRFKVFDGVREYLGSIMGSGYPPEAAQHKYLEVTAGSGFLFSQEIAGLVERIWKLSCDLEAHKHELPGIPPGEQRTQIIKKQRVIKESLLDELKSLEKTFAPHLNIEQPLWGKKGGS